MASFEVPSWVIYGGVFLGAAISYIVVRLGKFWSQRPGMAQFEVAGALVDSSAVKDLTKALEAHTEMQRDLTKAIEAQSKAESDRTVMLKDCAHSLMRRIEGHGDQLKDMTSEMRRLHEDMIVFRQK